MDTDDLSIESRDYSIDSDDTSSENDGSCVVPFDYAHAANILTKDRGLRYNQHVNPNATPRPVNKVWTEMVRLFKEPLKATTPGNASIKEPIAQEQADIPCPEELKNVLKKAYANENHLNVELFNTLHTCLYDAKVVDAFKTQDTTDDAREDEMKPKAKDYAENENEKKSANPKNETMIFFTHGKFGDYAIGFAREANGEQKHQTSQSALGKRKRDNGTPSSAGNSQQTDSGVGHYACLFVVNKMGKIENVMSLSLIELKLADPSTVTCAAIPEKISGEALSNSLDLGNTRGSFAQVMLYTMRYVLPSLAKIDQLEATIPWGVLVCEYQSKKAIEQSSSNTASKSSTQTSMSGKPPLPPTRSDRSNRTPSAGSRVTPRDQNSDDSHTSYCSNKSIEMAVSENTASRSPLSNRWVSGRIYVPEACGKPFRYAVTGFGGFQAAEEDEAVNNALSIYLATLLSGLLAAKEWLISLMNGKACLSRPTTGQLVMIGAKKLTSPLVSPTSSQEETVGEESLVPFADVARPASSQAETVDVTILTSLLTLRGRLGKLAPDKNCPYSEWKIDQGEIFTGTLNVRRLADEVDLDDSKFMVVNNEDTVMNVALKVSSKVIHNSLVDPYKAWNALKVLHQQVKGKKEWLRQHEAWEQTMMQLDAFRHQHSLLEFPVIALEEPSMPSPPPPKLDDVLLAVYRPADNSLITITKDLSASYNILLPVSCGIALSTLWKAFIELLRNVLIPMADLEVIHPDIRPGYDETSNILWKVSEVDENKGALMQLIDFESITEFEDWYAPYGSKSLYIRRQDGWNAKTFLWWQSVAVAYAWKYRKSQEEMANFSVISFNESQHPWLNFFLCSWKS